MNRPPILSGWLPKDYGWRDLQVPDVPLGTSGPWLVDQFTVTEAEARFACMLPRRMGGSSMFAGVTYTRLRRNGYLVMSDTTDEIHDHFCTISRAKGHVLIHGLGIGMVLNACCRKREVEHVTCVEVSPELIAHVGEHYRKKWGDRITIVCADALAWQPPRGARFGVVWHDIWDDICADNLESMKTLHRRYGRRAEWQGSWSREMCESQ